MTYVLLSSCVAYTLRWFESIQLTVGTTAKTPIHIPLNEMDTKDAAVYAITVFTEVRIGLFVITPFIDTSFTIIDCNSSTGTTVQAQSSCVSGQILHSCPPAKHAAT